MKGEKNNDNCQEIEQNVHTELNRIKRNIKMERKIKHEFVINISL